MWVWVCAHACVDGDGSDCGDDCRPAGGGVCIVATRRRHRRRRRQVRVRVVCVTCVYMCVASLVESGRVESEIGSDRI